MLGSADTAAPDPSLTNTDAQSSDNSTSGLASFWNTVSTDFWAIGNGAYDAAAAVGSGVKNAVTAPFQVANQALTTVEIVLILIAVALVLLIIYSPGALGSIARLGAI